MPVLDASFLIALERGHIRAVALSEKLSAQRRSLWIPAVVWMEVLAGAPASRRAAVGHRLAEIGACVSLDRDVAELAADLQGGLARAGKRLGWNDIQVAATGLHLGEPIVTMDRDFAGIAGLEVIRP